MVDILNDQRSAYKCSPTNNFPRLVPPSTTITCLGSLPVLPPDCTQMMSIFQYCTKCGNSKKLMISWTNGLPQFRCVPVCTNSQYLDVGDVCTACDTGTLAKTNCLTCKMIEQNTLSCDSCKSGFNFYPPNTNCLPPCTPGLGCQSCDNATRLCSVCQPNYLPSIPATINCICIPGNSCLTCDNSNGNCLSCSAN